MMLPDTPISVGEWIEDRFLEQYSLLGQEGEKEEELTGKNRLMAALIKLRYICALGVWGTKAALSRETFILPAQVHRFINHKEFMEMLRSIKL